MNKSVEIQQATRVFIDNTPHSCVMTSLQKILELYKPELKQKYGDGKYSHEIWDELKKILDNNNFDQLTNCLPEINDKTFYHVSVTSDRKGPI